MILNLILAVVTLSSLTTVALVQANREITDSARAIAKRHGIAGVGVGCMTAVFGLTMVVLWTWYAIDVHDWRFAAIVWIPFSANYISRLTSNRGAA